MGLGMQLITMIHGFIQGQEIVFPFTKEVRVKGSTTGQHRI